ncbi:thyA [Wigglesworthia glossinidia endosymbiont of Glossina brevipalpis]|uniref:Thymidylate synthase n=1 Tax=Wigglesworthia glossinidia brevipalpis TaxID=36870 RepID=TYSY_WIGBR|nr:RecName: Full=Thymidylate synthase; Short=TS; Short=TSase [Wigglesworthia glossinidia endosymbiont of Glossina brevipalpis]BAC24466.1 thyA [Wigglesworthia glossinidia endosymbiont of Glossina brevipalpis]
MKEYLDLLNLILKNGYPKIDRTKTGTLSMFGYQIRINLNEGFPLLTTKYCHFKSIVYELLWFLRGDTNISFLKKNNISIWNKWADKNGNLGPIYGKQWRAWEDKKNNTIDQIEIALNKLKKEPSSRRILVSSWNVGELDLMSIPPCHVLFQLYVINNKLSCQVYQRSCDIFLGLPFNIGSYALLTHIFANQCDLLVEDLIWTGGDIHLYKNHLNQAKLQLTRSPLPLPKIFIKKKPKNLFNYAFNDFLLIDYNHHPKIKAPISI